MGSSKTCDVTSLIDQINRSRLIFSIATNSPLNFSSNKSRKAGGKDGNSFLDFALILDLPNDR